MEKVGVTVTTRDVDEPAGAATRAQAAVVTARLLHLLGKV